MAYFLILPVFVIWVLFACAAIVATRSFPSLSGAFPSVWRIALWATVGVVAANAALVLLLTVGFATIGSSAPPESAGRDVFQFVWGLTAIGGPLLASLLGWVAGAGLGAVFALRRNPSAVA